MLQVLRQIRSGRALALLALAGPLLGAAPSTPPPAAVSYWEQYVLLQLVAWDGDLFAYGWIQRRAPVGRVRPVRS
jgi:hypothetical protein